MIQLILGLLLFLGVHCARLFRKTREAARDRLGANGYRGVYSLVSAVGLGLIVWGMSVAPYEALWQPPAWGRKLVGAVMPIAFVLVVAGNFPNNLKRWLRHPMLIGTLLWAGAHLGANGDLASVLLFGGFAAWAGVILINALGRPTPPIAPSPWWRDAVAVVAGLAAYAVVLRFHLQLFGMPAL